MNEIEPIRALNAEPLDGVTPTDLFSTCIGSPEENVAWNFCVGDPEFWKFSRQLLVPGGRLLDLGIGLGRTSLAFALQGMEVTGYDTSDRAVRILRGLVKAYPFLPIEVRQEDIIKANLGHEEFDTVMLGQTFIHFPNKALAFTVLDKAGDALKPGGHLWVRAGGKEDCSYEEMKKEAGHSFSDTERIDDDVFTRACGCSGEYKSEPQLFFAQTELLEYFLRQGFKITHSQLMPEAWQANIMYGEDWMPDVPIPQAGIVTILAQKR